MRSILFAVLLVAAAAAPLQSASPDRPPEPVTLDHPLFTPFRTVQAFDCRDVACTRLRSCEEACYKLMVCGQRKRDGDGDGIPCENLCSRRC